MVERFNEIHEFMEQGIREVTADEVLAMRKRPDSSQRSSGKVFISVAGCGVVLAAALIVLLVVVPSNTPAGPMSAAATEFHLLAARAADVPALGPSQYYYTEIERQTNVIADQLSPGGATIHEYLNGTQQTWINAQGYGRMVITTDAAPQFFTESDREKWVAAGSPPVSVPPSHLNEVVAITPTSNLPGSSSSPLFDLTGLPSDPTVLQQILASGRFASQLPSGPACSDSNCTVVAAAAALLQGPDIGGTPELRSALFDVLAHVPGVVDLGNVTRRGGAVGIGLSFMHTTPAHTESVQCTVRGSQNASAGSPVQAGPPSATSATPFEEPASTDTLQLTIDPATTAVLSTQQTITPDTEPMVNVCPGQPGYGGTPQLTWIAPVWTTVLSEQIVSSDTATSAQSRGPSSQ